MSSDTTLLLQKTGSDKGTNDDTTIVDLVSDFQPLVRLVIIKLVSFFRLSELLLHIEKMLDDFRFR